MVAEKRVPGHTQGLVFSNVEVDETNASAVLSADLDIERLSAIVDMRYHALIVGLDS